jgi:hypothetical protein
MVRSLGCELKMLGVFRVTLLEGFIRSHVPYPTTGTVKPLCATAAVLRTGLTQRSPAIEGAPLLEGRSLKIRRYPRSLGCYFQLNMLSLLKVRGQREKSNFSRPYSTTRFLPFVRPSPIAQNREEFLYRILSVEK